MDLDEGVVFLEVNSWVGVSMGATHTYGELVSEVNAERVAVKVSQPRSVADAERDNQDAVDRYGEVSRGFYEAGSETTGFASREAVVKRARQVWRQHFPEGWLLV